MVRSEAGLIQSGLSLEGRLDMLRSIDVHQENLILKSENEELSRRVQELQALITELEPLWLNADEALCERCVKAISPESEDSEASSWGIYDSMAALFGCAKTRDRRPTAQAAEQRDHAIQLMQNRPGGPDYFPMCTPRRPGGLGTIREVNPNESSANGDEDMGMVTLAPDYFQDLLDKLQHQTEVNNRLGRRLSWYEEDFDWQPPEAQDGAESTPESLTPEKSPAVKNLSPVNERHALTDDDEDSDKSDSDDDDDDDFYSPVSSPGKHLSSHPRVPAMPSHPRVPAIAQKHLNPICPAIGDLSIDLSDHQNLHNQTLMKTPRSLSENKTPRSLSENKTPRSVQIPSSASAGYRAAASEIQANERLSSASAVAPSQENCPEQMSS